MQVLIYLLCSTYILTTSDILCNYLINFLIIKGFTNFGKVFYLSLKQNCTGSVHIINISFHGHAVLTIDSSNYR